MTADAAGEIIRRNRFLVLGTADEDGVPWVSPVWFATADGREFLWASAPEARHSRNLAARPEIGVVIFDSTAPPAAAQAFYASAVAEQVDGDAVDRALEVYSGHSVAQGLAAWTAAGVTAPARHRLYRATLQECFVLRARRDRRVAVPGLGTRAAS